MLRRSVLVLAALTALLVGALPAVGASVRNWAFNAANNPDVVVQGYLDVRLANTQDFKGARVTRVTLRFFPSCANVKSGLITGKATLGRRFTLTNRATKAKAVGTVSRSSIKLTLSKPAACDGKTFKTTLTIPYDPNDGKLPAAVH